jgi:L-alanine-DL-glutamate epimerase-like enolase superfamily enzyme
MSTYELLADLPLVVESYALEGLARDVSSGFRRQTTIIRLHGGGEEGVGEDVVYDGEDHDALQQAGAYLDLSTDGAGRTTLGDFCERIDALDLFPVEPVRGEVSRLYRRWAFHSAALDLALRQVGKPLHEVLGKQPRPMSFVNSRRLPEEDGVADVAPLLRIVERYPTLRFKLDPTPAWDDGIIAALAATGAMDSLDYKGLYKGTIVDNPADPVFYARIAEGFPDAWLEDPDLDAPGIDEVLEPHRDRITWDAPIHSIDDIEALPFAPRMVNVKPSRFGGLARLCAGYDYCAEHGIGAYGGGQFELGVGRGQAQYLASLFHPDTPNDLAPGGYNETDPPDGLPPSPLEPKPSATGFRWES